jgi:hypothetical protein
MYIPSNIHGGDAAKTARLDYASDNGDETIDDQSRLASIFISHPRSEETTKETSSLEGRRDVGRQVGVLLLSLRFAWESVFTMGQVSSSGVMAGCRYTYAMKAGNVNTPPIVPISNPNSIPPKHAEHAIMKARHP